MKKVTAAMKVKDLCSFGGKPTIKKNEDILLINKSESEVKVSQSCLTVCNSMNYTVHGILQAKILE